MLLKKILLGLSLLLCFAHCEFAGAQTTKLVVAYASPAATFCPGWIAKKEGIFAKYGLDVEMVLMQGASVYMPALASGNIQVLYGGGTAVSRAIATGGFDLMVIATETRYVPLRLMVHPAIQRERSWAPDRPAWMSMRRYCFWKKTVWCRIKTCSLFTSPAVSRAEPRR